MRTLRVSLFAFFLLCTTGLFAQDQQQKNNKQETIESLHTAFITQKLNLTPEEAEKFWPVYNQFHADLETIKKQRADNKAMIDKAGGIDNMSDADVQKLIASETDIQSRELDVRKQYITKFEAVISAKKVAKFYIAEEEFKLYLLKQLANRRQQRRQQQGGWEQQ